MSHSESQLVMVCSRSDGTECVCNLFKGSLVRAFLAAVVEVVEVLRLARWRCCSLQREPRGQEPVFEKSGHTRVCFFLH